MNRLRFKLLGLFLVAFIVLASFSIFAPPGRAESFLGSDWVVTNSSRIWLEGSTNINVWSCETNQVTGRLRTTLNNREINELAIWARSAEPGILHPDTDPIAPRDKNHVFFAVPIDSLNCGNKIMEKDLQRAMKSKISPEIRYEFDKVTHILPDDNPAGSISLRIKGSVSAAGRTRVMPGKVKVERLNERFYRITGTLSLKMTQFDIKPPTAIFGIIKANDELMVRFNIVTKSIPR